MTHLSDPPGGGTQQLGLYFTPPVGRVNHRDSSPQFRTAVLPKKQHSPRYKYNSLFKNKIVLTVYLTNLLF